VKPVKYEDWSENDSTLGVMALVTQKIMEKGMPEAINKVGELMGHSVARALFKVGSKVPDKVKTDLERDETLRGWKVYLYADAEFDKTPEQYCFMAWERWQEEHTQRLNWENKSFWQYLKWWFKRKLGGEQCKN